MNLANLIPPPHRLRKVARLRSAVQHHAAQLNARYEASRLAYSARLGRPIGPRNAVWPCNGRAAG